MEDLDNDPGGDEDWNLLPKVAKTGPKKPCQMDATSSKMNESAQQISGFQNMTETVINRHVTSQ